MPQLSYPQPGLFPADGPDCGAYTANEWRGLLLSMMRSGGMVNTGAVAPPGLPATPLFPNVGVFYVCPNRLAITSTGDALISIDTGAWMCDGTFGFNDTAIVDTPIAVGPRIGDMIVVRQNYDTADYISTVTTALTVPANTARVVGITAAEFQQNQDREGAVANPYWDIPLASFDIAAAPGAITNLADRREWVDAETKRIFAPFVYGAVAAVEVIQTQYGVMIDTGMATLAYARTAVPKNFISGMLATPIIIKDTAAAGNLQIGNFVAQYGTCDEALPHTDQSGVTVIAIAGAASTIKCLTDVQLALSNAAIDDYICFYLQRDNAGTYAASLYAMGVDVEYFGWGRK